MFAVSDCENVSILNRHLGNVKKLIGPDNPHFHICSSELYLSDRVSAFRLSSIWVELSIMLGGSKLRRTQHQGCFSRYHNITSSVSKLSSYHVLLLGFGFGGLFCKAGSVGMGAMALEVCL